jgi:DNA-binding Xre family transcriptional regulator
MPIVDAERLHYEKDIRGLRGADLARMAAIDHNTLSRALARKPVTTRTLMKITSGLLNSAVTQGHHGHG